MRSTDLAQRAHPPPPHAASPLGSPHSQGASRNASSPSPSRKSRCQIAWDELLPTRAPSSPGLPRCSGVSSLDSHSRVTGNRGHVARPQKMHRGRRAPHRGRVWLDLQPSAPRQFLVIGKDLRPAPAGATQPHFDAKVDVLVLCYWQVAAPLTPLSGHRCASMVPLSTSACCPKATSNEPVKRPASPVSSWSILRLPFMPGLA